MAKTYYIFRHGDTHATKTKTPYGDGVLTAPILPESKTYLEKIGFFLKNIPHSYNVSSEILRCRQTVEIVALAADKPFVFDKRLNEYNMETFDDYANRIMSFLSDVEQKAIDHIVICTHGAGIAALKHLLIRNELVEENLIDFSDPGVLTIIKHGTIEEIDFRNL